MDIPLPEIISGMTAIAATSFTFVRYLFKKLETFEQKFTASILKLSDIITDIDKRLAVNTILIEKIDQFIEERHYHGRNLRDKKAY